LPDGFEALPDYGLPLGILARPPIAANDNPSDLAVHSISGILVKLLKFGQRLGKSRFRLPTIPHHAAGGAQTGNGTNCIRTKRDGELPVPGDLKSVHG
jgi:hypothetical protein